MSTTSSTVTESQVVAAQHAGTARVLSLALAFVLSIALILGVGSTAQAAVSQAPAASVQHPAATLTVPQSSSSCSAWHTCTVYFTKHETSVWAKWGQVPPVPWYLPTQFKIAYYGAIYGLRPFAVYYANRGMCSAYRISLVPWASQGYVGYRC